MVTYEGLHFIGCSITVSSRGTHVVNTLVSFAQVWVHCMLKLDGAGLTDVL